MDRAAFTAAIIDELERQRRAEAPAQPFAASEGFRLLSHDMPWVSQAQLSAFNGWLQGALLAGAPLQMPRPFRPAAPFLLSRKFLAGVAYLVQQAEPVSGGGAGEEAEEGLLAGAGRAGAAELSRTVALTLLKLLRRMLMMPGPDLAFLLQRFDKPDELHVPVEEPSGEEEKEEALPEPPEEEAEVEFVPDGPGFVFESDVPEAGEGDGALARNIGADDDDGGDDPDDVTPAADVQWRWGQLRGKLIALLSQLTSTALAALPQAQWEALELLDDLMAVVALLRGQGVPADSAMSGQDEGEPEADDASIADLGRCWPRFLFLLRDRALQFPEQLCGAAVDRLADVWASAVGDTYALHHVLRTMAALAASDAVRRSVGSRNALDMWLADELPELGRKLAWLLASAEELADALVIDEVAAVVVLARFALQPTPAALVTARRAAALSDAGVLRQLAQIHQSVVGDDWGVLSVLSLAGAASAEARQFLADVPGLKALRAQEGARPAATAVWMFFIAHGGRAGPAAVAPALEDALGALLGSPWTSAAAREAVEMLRLFAAAPVEAWAAPVVGPLVRARLAEAQLALQQEPAVADEDVEPGPGPKPASYTDMQLLRRALKEALAAASGDGGKCD